MSGYHTNIFAKLSQKCHTVVYMYNRYVCLKNHYENAVSMRIMSTLSEKATLPFSSLLPFTDSQWWSSVKGKDAIPGTCAFSFRWTPFWKHFFSQENSWEVTRAFSLYKNSRKTWARLFKTNDAISKRDIKISNVNISNIPIFFVEKM